MKIIICLNEDVHSATALNLLFEELKNYQIIIVMSKKVGKIQNLSFQLEKLRKFEQEDLRKLFSKIDSQKLTTKQGKFKSFKQIAKILNAEILTYENINSPKAIADFTKFSPDLIISIRFGQIFKSEIIKTSKCGIINLHSGILPNYRGIMPSFWAILNSEATIGMTLHYIENDKIDAGKIIAFSHFELNKNHSLVFNINKLYEGGCELISRHLENILTKKEIKLTENNIAKGKYFSYPNEFEIASFLKIMPLTTKEDQNFILEKFNIKRVNGINSLFGI